MAKHDPVVTPKKTNAEFAGFTRRIIRAHAVRVSKGDIEALSDLLQLQGAVIIAVDNAVAGLRAYGYSWSEIARVVGTSKQAAQQRWGGRE